MARLEAKALSSSPILQEESFSLFSFPAIWGFGVLFCCFQAFTTQGTERAPRPEQGPGFNSLLQDPGEKDPTHRVTVSVTSLLCASVFEPLLGGSVE